LKNAAPVLTDIRHTKLCYDKARMCAHPRQCPMGNFGSGEIVVLHHHAPCAYETPEDVSHGPFGYKGRAKILLQRSLDHGETWPHCNDVVVWDDSLPLEEKRSLLWKADDPDAARDEIDLSGPDSMVYFPRPATGPEDDSGRAGPECFAFRSGDRGRSWDAVPTRVSPPPGYNYVHVDGYAPVKFSDGTVMVAATVQDTNAGVKERRDIVALYGSDDGGITWEYLAEVAHDPSGKGRPTYANLLQLPGGRLQCYMLNIDGIRNAIQLACSDDGGFNWSDPKPIVAWGQSPWVTQKGGYAWSGARRKNYHYRSPWPLRLRDGRIVVLFGRRKRPFGIGLIISEDEGESWSSEAVLRADASDVDLGYPVATQLDDGRIFTAYYFMEDDGNNLGGTRFIAASFFKV
jgi:hypothetical protein